MNKFGKATLLAGASAVALGLATTQASAFDKVDWDWNANIREKINIRIDIREKFDPSGLVQVESLQVFVGDLKASASVGKAVNIPEVTDHTHKTYRYAAKGSLDANASYEKGYAYKGGRYFKKCWWGCKGGSMHYGGYGWEGGYASLSADFDASLSYTVPVFAALDAQTQLPLIEVSATAIANAKSIESEAGVLVHDGQFVWGDGDVDESWKYDKNAHVGLADEVLEETDVSDHDAMRPAQIHADATIGAAYNYQVDLDATAVANSHSIDVDAFSAPGDEENAFIIADITQVAFANVSANAHLPYTVVENYKNLGKLDSALTSVTATAIGNVSSITLDINNNGNNGGGGNP